MEGQHRVGKMRQGRGDQVEGVEEEGKTGARVEDGEKRGGQRMERREEGA
jgi:hypothetical protein